MADESPVTKTFRFGDKPAPGDDFRVTLAEAQITAPRDYFIPKFGAGNFFRGQWGKELFQKSPDLFRNIFAPERRQNGPSGLADPPRAFVLRVRDWDEKSVQAGQSLAFHLHFFCPLPGTNLRPIAQKLLCQNEPISASTLKISFLTPTDLKGGPPSDFPTLLARARDRVSTLRSIYQGGPLDLDFRAFVARAHEIRTVSQNLRWINQSRRSASNQQIHPLCGWVGEVQLAGELGPFIPLLQMAEYTGIGRHTVWGQGEIKVSAE